MDMKRVPWYSELVVWAAAHKRFTVVHNTLTTLRVKKMEGADGIEEDRGLPSQGRGIRLNWEETALSVVRGWLSVVNSQKGKTPRR
ncbi:MAG: hypothetical protein MUO52_01235, partial [Desulfobacterales bacterium]|nr:hypothetical protein [Desulfobacterales bacterium]